MQVEWVCVLVQAFALALWEQRTDHGWGGCEGLNLVLALHVNGGSHSGTESLS